MAMNLFTKSNNDSLLKQGLEIGLLSIGVYFGGSWLLGNVSQARKKSDAENLVLDSIITEGKTTSGQYTAVVIARMLIEALSDFDANENIVWKIFGTDKKPAGLVQSREFLNEVREMYYRLTQRKQTLEQGLKSISLGLFRNFNSSDYQEVLRSLERINRRSRSNWKK